MFAIRNVRHNNVRFSISIKRSFMNALLLGYLGYQILNADESPFYPFRCRGKIVIDRAMLNTSTWKERDTKKRVTFFPVVQFARKLGLTPAFVLDCKCTKWSIKPLKIEEKKVVYRNEERTLLRKTFKDFVVYYSSNAWINRAIYAWEL